MSNTVSQQAHGRTYVAADEQEREVSGWIGWVFFGAFLMSMMGIFQALAGVVALFRDTWFVVSTDQILVFNSVQAWGWANLIIGIVVMMAGFALMSGANWARVLAVLVALGAAITNMLSISLYPVWSIISITLAVLVMYAVIVHGRDLHETE